MAEPNDGQGGSGSESQRTVVISPCEILPPPFPERPDLFDEVNWGPHPTDEDVRRAYTIWSAQDSVIALAVDDMHNPPPQDVTSNMHNPMNCLVENVYQNLMQSSLLPISPDQGNAAAQYRQVPNSKSTKGWTYEELFGEEVPAIPMPAQPPSEPIRINGRVKGDKRWTRAAATEELQKRGLDAKGKVGDLRERLFADEVEKRARPLSPPLLNEDKTSQFRREDLSEWGLPRRGVHVPKITGHEELSPLDIYTWAILLSPYNPAYWTSRAFLHYQMGFPDLAIGDAYRAQLLCEVLVNPLARNTQPGLYIRIWDAIERHVLQIPRVDGRLGPEVEFLRWSNGVNHFIPTVRKAIHHIIALSLLALQSWRDYQVTEPHLRTRLVMPDRDAIAIKSREEGLKPFISTVLGEKEASKEEFYYEGRYGSMPGNLYPYGPKEDPRNTDGLLKKINNDVLGRSQASNLHSQKIEVRWSNRRDEPQLGVWATQDIPEGEIVYVDEPSIRGHLRVGRPGEVDYFCENCKRPLDPVDLQEGSVIQENFDVCPCSGPNSEAMYWCPPPPVEEEEEEEEPEDNSDNVSTTKGKRGKKRPQDHDDQDEQQSSNKKQKTASCLDIARSLYHHRACGKNWTWLHDAMRPVFSEGDHRTGRGPHITHTNEGHGTALSLLLREVFDITLHRREVEGKPNLLAYEIDELMPLAGAGSLHDHNIPFSFAANIRVPFDILSFLGVNIFRDLTFDTWVIQVVLRKLILNAIPWDKTRQLMDRVDPVESKNLKKGSLLHLQEDEFNKVDPTFKDLYILPGAAMFDHSCLPHDNVMCDWDKAVPNRAVILATRAIEKGEELLFRYSNFNFDIRRGHRILGGPCYCETCRGHSPARARARGSSYYGSNTSTDSPEPPSARDRQPVGSETQSSGEARSSEQSVSQPQHTVSDPSLAPAFTPAPAPAAAAALPSTLAATGTTMAMARSSVEATASQPPASRPQSRRGPRIRYKGQNWTRDQYNAIIAQEREKKKAQQGEEEERSGSDSGPEQSSSSGPEYPVGGSARYLSKHGG